MLQKYYSPASRAWTYSGLGQGAATHCPNSSFLITAGRYCGQYVLVPLKKVLEQKESVSPAQPSCGLTAHGHVIEINVSTDAPCPLFAHSAPSAVPRERQRQAWLERALQGQIFCHSCSPTLRVQSSWESWKGVSNASSSFSQCSHQSCR